MPCSPSSPQKGDHEEHLRKLWDHVWIMSDYRLDVDYPYEHVNPEVFADRPDAVEPVRPALCLTVTTDASYRGLSTQPRLWRKARTRRPRLHDCKIR